MSEELAAESGVRRTLAEYCQALDDGRFDEWVDVFADDVVFVVMGNRLEGRAATRAFIEPTQPADARGRHLLSEPLIDVDVGSGTATATTDYAFVTRDNRVMSSGRYHDRLRDDGDRWRFAHREIVFTGDQPEATD